MILKKFCELEQLMVRVITENQLSDLCFTLSKLNLGAASLHRLKLDNF